MGITLINGRLRLIGKLKELRPNINSCNTALENERKDPEASHLIESICDQKPILGLNIQNHKMLFIFWVGGQVTYNKRIMSPLRGSKYRSF